MQALHFRSVLRSGVDKIQRDMQLARLDDDPRPRNNSGVVASNAPLCSQCGRPVVPLLVTTVCDWCDGAYAGPLYGGYVVWRGHQPGRREYVFRTLPDAETWAAASGIYGAAILPVWCEVPFRWRTSAGTIQGIELADVLYDVFPSRHFPVGPQRAFLAKPPNLSAAS